MGNTYTTLSFEPPQTDPKETYLRQMSPTQNTWYTILDLSGSGYLHEVRCTENLSGVYSVDMEIRFTIDGGTAQISSFDYEYLDRIEVTVSTKVRRELRFQRVRFFTSLKVEMRSIKAAPGTLHGKVYYSQV